MKIVQYLVPQQCTGVSIAKEREGELYACYSRSFIEENATKCFPCSHICPYINFLGT